MSYDTLLPRSSKVAFTDKNGHGVLNNSQLRIFEYLRIMTSSLPVPETSIQSTQTPLSYAYIAAACEGPSQIVPQALIHKNDHHSSIKEEQIEIATGRNSPKKDTLIKKPYQCTICSKGFTTKSYFTQHVAVHREGKTHCPVCNKSFNVKWYVRDHMRLHTGEKPYECSLCGKSFSFKSHLDWHKSKHSE